MIPILLKSCLYEPEVATLICRRYAPFNTCSDFPYSHIEQVKIFELDQPRGWQHFKLGNAADAEEDEAINYADPDA